MPNPAWLELSRWSRWGFLVALVIAIYYLFKSFINRDHPSPPHEYRSFSGEENPIDENCIICLERLSGIRELRMLTSGHMFHDHCITTALNQRRQCPICRIAS